MAHVEDYLNGHLISKVPESTYDKYIKESYEKDFDPALKNVKFDPERHLSYYANGELAKYKYNNTRRLTMEELGLTNPKQISHIGVSDPFPLFTEEAIKIMRQEVLDKENFKKYANISNMSASGKDCNIRGYAKPNGEVNTQFIHDAWTHPKTMELVSRMAGIDLKIVVDYEIAHTNVSIKDKEETKAELEQYKKNPKRDMSKDCVVNWHYDSYPFVCVLMLSDTTNMIGGETSLRMGKGTEEDNVAVVPGPISGYACILQGGLIEHIAPNPIGVSERITMVTSYKAKDPRIYDNSGCRTVKPETTYGTRYHEFYPEWVKYRADVITERLELLKQEVKKDGKFDKESTTKELKEIEAFLKQTYTDMELTEEDNQKIKAKYDMMVKKVNA